MDVGILHDVLCESHLYNYYNSILKDQQKRAASNSLHVRSPTILWISCHILICTALYTAHTTSTAEVGDHTDVESSLYSQRFDNLHLRLPAVSYSMTCILLTSLIIVQPFFYFLGLTAFQQPCRACPKWCHTWCYID